MKDSSLIPNFLLIQFPAKAAYVKPKLEQHHAWKAVTGVPQSVPITLGLNLVDNGF